MVGVQFWWTFKEHLAQSLYCSDAFHPFSNPAVSQRKIGFYALGL